MNYESKFTRLRRMLFINLTSPIIYLDTIIYEFIKLFSKRSNHKIVKCGYHQDKDITVEENILNSLKKKLDNYKPSSPIEIKQFEDDGIITLPVEDYKIETSHIIKNKKIRKFLSFYYGIRGWKMTKPVCWRLTKINKDFNKSSPTARYWHTDDVRPDYMKLFININNITDQHGPFHALPKKITQKILIDTYGADRYLLKNKDFDKDVIKGIGPIGHTLFCRTGVCLHRSGSPEKDRDILQLQFVRKNRFILF